MLSGSPLYFQQSGSPLKVVWLLMHNGVAVGTVQKRSTADSYVGKA